MIILSLYKIQLKSVSSDDQLQTEIRIFKLFLPFLCTNVVHDFTWTKISGLETNIFGLKMMAKSGLNFFILKFY